MIGIKEVNFSYNGHPVLRNINIEFTSGKLHAVLGPNGAGKSTLLKLMVGINQTDSGEITLSGENIRHYTRKKLARTLAYVPQNMNIYFRFKVKEIVTMGRYPFHDSFANLTREELRLIDEKIDLVGAGALRERYLDTLSGGERQLIMIAAALVQEPQYMLLDEPGASLDIHNQLQIYAILRHLVEKQGLTVIAVTHQPELALNYADRVMVMNKGKIAALGEVKEIAASTIFNDVFKVNGETIYNRETGRWHFMLEGMKTDDG